MYTCIFYYNSFSHIYQLQDLYQHINSKMGINSSGLCRFHVWLHKFWYKISRLNPCPIPPSWASSRPKTRGTSVEGHSYPLPTYLLTVRLNTGNRCLTLIFNVYYYVICTMVNFIVLQIWTLNAYFSSVINDRGKWFSIF